MIIWRQTKVVQPHSLDDSHYWVVSTPKKKRFSFLQSVFTQSLENVFFTRQTSALNISDHRQWDPLMCLTTVPFVRTSADITYLNESTLIAWNYPCVWCISAASVLTLGVPIRWSPQRNSRAKLAVIFYHTGVKEKCDHYYLLQKKNGFTLFALWEVGSTFATPELLTDKKVKNSWSKKSSHCIGVTETCWAYIYYTLTSYCSYLKVLQFWNYNTRSDLWLPVIFLSSEDHSGFPECLWSSMWRQCLAHAVSRFESATFWTQAHFLNH